MGVELVETHIKIKAWALRQAQCPIF